MAVSQSERILRRGWPADLRDGELHERRVSSKNRRRTGACFVCTRNRRHEKGGPALEHGTSMTQRTENLKGMETTRGPSLASFGMAGKGAARSIEATAASSSSFEPELVATSR